MARKKTPVRDPLREWPDQTPVATPVSFRGMPTQVDEVKAYFEEWSRSQAEAEHVETIEEANDFSIQDEEDEDFFHNITPFEMHEVLETQVEAERLEGQELPEEEAVVAESNETVNPGESPKPSHDQSAPDDNNATRQNSASEQKTA